MRPLNLIPLIDLFLLLALFGLMLARFPEALSGGALQERALRVELPQGEGVPGGGAVRVELDREGRLALNGKPVRDLPALEAALKALDLAGRPVRLEADARVAHGQVVAVMEAVRRAGGERVQVAVRR
ncbi:ExbD/TolR family protein [Thermus tengchongensis]|uniref:ExbD/TolR family protein n=1 Tax=Thermus tengchongensis TaxID=1214928 RepID=UPI000570C988|nr:biopolymer transporter ExbD [Thermus tengchongensis]